jgi:hypothetical protein
MVRTAGLATLLRTSTDEEHRKNARVTLILDGLCDAARRRLSEGLMSTVHLVTIERSRQV